MRDDLREILDGLDIEQWCEDEGITFKRTRGVSGAQLNIKECPQCSDRKWRTYLNAESGVGNCFICNETFNKYTFINTYLGISARETIARIKTDARNQGWRPKRMATAAVENKVKLPTSFALPTPAGESLVYLEQRRIDDEIAKYFHLRCCLQGTWNFTRDDGSPGFQKFDNRLIIPVYDLDGSLVTFQGRDLTGTAERKYLFPMGLPGTGRFLLNGQNVIKCSEIVLAEGAFDVMAIKIAFNEDVNLRGIEAVGTFGKHLSSGSDGGNDQLSRLMKLKAQGVKRATIMWDGEAQALEAALDTAALLTRHGLEMKIALLPANRDPNEVTGEVVRTAFYQAQPYSSKLLIQWKLRSPYKLAG
jgi:DNA primase